MDLSKVFYICDSDKYFADVVCDQCKQKPAVKLEADCHGDAISLCKEHWVEWFNVTLLPAFNENVKNKYMDVGITEYNKINYDKIYRLK